MKIGRDQRRALIAGLLVFGGLVGTGYVTLLRPSLERSEVRQHQLENLHRQAGEARGAGGRLTELRERVDRLWQSFFLPPQAEAAVHSEIRALAAKHGLEIQELSAGPTVERSFSEVRSTHCKLLGSRPSVNAFFEDLRQGPWVQLLESRIHGTARRHGQVEADFRLETVHAGEHHDGS